MELNYKDIRIGKLIENLVRKKSIGTDRVCNFLNIEESELEKIYESKSMDTDLLLRWSKLLEYDFFRIYSQHLLFYAPSTKMKQKKKAVNKAKNTPPSFTKSLYTPEIIQFILELIEHKKKTPAEIIEQYRIPKTTVYRWIGKHKNIEN